MGLGATRRRVQKKEVKIAFESLDSWDQGVYSRVDRDRIPLKGLSDVLNVQLNGDGIIEPRPGTKLYGTYQPTGTVIGQPYEFLKYNTTTKVFETWMIWMENQSGTGNVLVNKNGGTPTTITGKTYDVTGDPHFEQVYGNVMITNGVDTLSYMVIDTLTITAFTALSTPTGATASVQTPIQGATYTLRYRVTAANQGETAGSTPAIVTTSKLRDVWNGTTEYITFTWNRVTGAQRYNIYVGDSAGNEYFLDTVSDSGSGTTQSYTDTGSVYQTTTRVTPAGDSTAGPRTTRVTNIKGQPYMVGDADNPGRIWFGGNGQSALDFSSYNGGGWVEPNKGGKDLPVKIVPFRDGKGTPMAACLSKGTNGAGKRYLLSPATTTVGTTVITYMGVQEDNGQDGTDSPDAVLVFNDALWYPSRSGFKTSTTKANIQNIISTQGISDNISVDVNNLTTASMSKAVGLPYDQRLYFAVPYSSTRNNQLWIVDLRQKGAWMRPWNIAVDALWLYADNSDSQTKMLALVGNKFVQFDPNTNTNDNGVAFQTNISTGAIKFGDNNESASVLDVTFEFLRPQGNIALAVNAQTDDGLIPFADTLPSSSGSSVGAWGRFGWGASGWGQVAANLIGVSTSTPKKQWTIEVGEVCTSLTMSVSTIESGVYYQLSKIIIRYVPVGYIPKDN